MKPIRVAEMFAGVGGFRLGLEGYGSVGDALYKPPAGNFKTVWANQWEPPGTEGKQFAWRCYEQRFGEGSCVNEDISKVLAEYEIGERDIPDFDMLVGGFPCFPAGTQVFTKRGYRSIEDIRVGDEVLTHQGCFKSVVKHGFKNNAALVEVKLMGSLPIICTPNHPFMVRERSRVYEDGTARYEFGPVVEKAAADLKPNVDFVLYPKVVCGSCDTDMTEEEAWLIGRYVADGHLDTRRRSGRVNSFNHKVIFSIGSSKADAFANMLDEYYATRCAHSKSTERFIITSERLIELVKRFTSGNRSTNKSLSPEALMLPDNLAAALLAGYEAGDGNVHTSNGDSNDRSITTTSRDLVRMLALLVRKVHNRIPSISMCERPSATEIEGRVVHQNDTYTVRYKKGDYTHQQFYEVEGDLFTPVRSVRTLDERAVVYIFEVEDDHTYVVENAVVHNCQDYSVAKPSSQARGIEGKKGVLWWDIYKMIHLKQPRYLLFENVDRLLKSPTKQRGRDFAIILSCLAEAGYSVEWRVINAAKYGMPQKRRRVYIYAEKADYAKWNLEDRLVRDGVMVEAFPIKENVESLSIIDISFNPYEVSESFGVGCKTSPFMNAGVMQAGKVCTAKVEAAYTGTYTILRDIVVPDADVPEAFFVDEAALERWRYLKGSKKEPRVAANGHEYMYSEGAMAFPDSLDKPARTLLTAEGGASPSRFKHVIVGDSGRYRRLVPDELDLIQTFPRGWTDVGMSDGRRAFCMGNALVVDVVYHIGKVIARRCG